MIQAFERLAESHPTFAEAVAALVIAALFGIVGGIERGHIPLPLWGVGA